MSETSLNLFYHTLAQKENVLPLKMIWLIYAYFDPKAEWSLSGFLQPGYHLQIQALLQFLPSSDKYCIVI